MTEEKAVKQCSGYMMQVAPMVAAGKTDEEISAITNVLPATIAKWRKKHPEFVALVNKCVNQAVEQQLTRLRSATSKAVDTLIKLCDDAEPNVRRQAAKDIVTFSKDSWEKTEIKDRLASLKKHAVAAKTKA